MKKRLLNQKSVAQWLYSLGLLLLCVNASWGQQTIGSFSTMDGGFEAQLTGALSAVTTSTSSVWTTTGSTNSTCKTDSPRTGGKYLTYASTSANRKLNSPTAAAAAISAATEYTIQFYYRTGATAPANNISTNVFYSDLAAASNTSGFTYTTFSPVFAANEPWTKRTVTITTPAGVAATSPKYGFFSPFRSGSFLGYIDIDDAVIYGYVGASTIGHELTHGFDDEGRQFDEKGNLKNWWSKEDEAKFKVKATLLVDQFNKYTVLDSLHPNGKATLGENIADLGGIVIALDAFKKTKQYQEGKLIAGLTPLQRYFMGYAYGWMQTRTKEKLAAQLLTDVHAPIFLRVNGPMSNCDEWYKTFNVTAQNKMYRDSLSRVRIW